MDNLAMNKSEKPCGKRINCLVCYYVIQKQYEGKG